MKNAPGSDGELSTTTMMMMMMMNEDVLQW